MFAIVLASCLLGQFGGADHIGVEIDPLTGLPRLALFDVNNGLVSAGVFVTPGLSFRKIPSTEATSAKAAIAVKAKPKPKRGKIKPRSASERIMLRRELEWTVRGL